MIGHMGEYVVQRSALRLTSPILGTENFFFFLLGIAKLIAYKQEAVTLRGETTYVGSCVLLCGATAFDGERNFVPGVKNWIQLWMNTVLKSSCKPVTIVSVWTQLGCLTVTKSSDLDFLSFRKIIFLQGNWNE